MRFSGVGAVGKARMRRQVHGDWALGKIVGVGGESGCSAPESGSSLRGARTGAKPDDPRLPRGLDSAGEGRIENQRRGRIFRSKCAEESSALPAGPAGGWTGAFSAAVGALPSCGADQGYGEEQGWEPGEGNVVDCSGQKGRVIGTRGRKARGGRGEEKECAHVKRYPCSQAMRGRGFLGVPKEGVHSLKASSLRCSELTSLSLLAYNDAKKRKTKIPPV